jgi:hypothetical protein
MQEIISLRAKYFRGTVEQREELFAQQAQYSRLKEELISKLVTAAQELEVMSSLLFNAFLEIDLESGTLAQTIDCVNC